MICKQFEVGGCGTLTNKVELTVTEKDGKFSISDEDLVQLDKQLVVYFPEEE